MISADIDLTKEARYLFEKHQIIIPIHVIVLSLVALFIGLIRLIMARSCKCK